MGRAYTAVKIALTIFGFLVFVTCGAFNFLANVPAGVGRENTTYNAAQDVFISDTEERSRNYPNQISPASWAFIIIWPLIFFWNGIGSFYLLVSLCLRRDRSPILRTPPLVPIASLILWSITWAGLIGWVFSHDREYYGLSMACIIVSALSGYACLAFSYRSYVQDKYMLEEDDARMLWLVRILFHNGFAILITWLTCAWKLEFVKVIAYVWDSAENKAVLRSESFTIEDSGTVALSILLFEIIAWFILENFVFEPYCRYTLTIYPVFIYALTAIYARNLYPPRDEEPSKRLEIIALVGAILTAVLFVVRVVLVVVRHRSKPRHA